MKVQEPKDGTPVANNPAAKGVAAQSTDSSSSAAGHILHLIARQDNLPHFVDYAEAGTAPGIAAVDYHSDQTGAIPRSTAEARSRREG